MHKYDRWLQHVIPPNTKCQLWKIRQVWVVTTASVQMVSRCGPGQKANHWHGMSQYPTPMSTPTSPTRRPQQGWQLTKWQATRRLNTGNYQQSYHRSSCHRVSRDSAPPSSGTSAGVAPTNNSCHWRQQGSKTFVSAAVSQRRLITLDNKT